MKNLISVICPTHNEPHRILKKTFDSILNQTYRDIELVIIDDGSTSPGVAKAIEQASKDSRTRVERREKKDNVRTVSESFNLGQKIATGNWIAHNASDNWFEIDWAERLVRFIKGREDDINGVCTNWQKHFYNGEIEYVDMTQRWDFSKPTLVNYIQTESLGGWIYKADWCKKIEWDTRFPRKQTREYNIRLFKTGDIIHYPKYLWHFEQWKEHHQCDYASVHWRVLADLKNDIIDINNLMFGIQLGRKHEDLYLYYAAVNAYIEFATDSMWKEDYEKSNFKEQMKRIKDTFWEEARERE